MYRAPVKDIRFVLDELIGTETLRACPEFADYSSETADAVLGEAARFAEDRARAALQERRSRRRAVVARTA